MLASYTLYYFQDIHAVNTVDLQLPLSFVLRTPPGYVDSESTGTSNRRSTLYNCHTPFDAYIRVVPCPLSYLWL
jgi:hypothetical protein